MVNSVARKIRMGMVGGESHGAFIGPLQRMAANLDGQVELVCGAFSNNPKRADTWAEELMLTPNRVYCDYPTMMAGEAQLPKHQRMDFVCIVTPNHLHLPIARVALEAGFHVLCDKPATINITEAKELAKLVKQSGCLYGLTHAYTDYPTAKEAQSFIRGFISDIARHAVNSAKYLMRKKITHVCAELSTFVAGRRLNDDGMMLLKMQDNFNGELQANLVAADKKKNLNNRDLTEKGGLELHQAKPNSLSVIWLFLLSVVLRSGGAHATLAASNNRYPMGHAQGYLEAFANIYFNFALAIRRHEQGENARAPHRNEPQIAGAVRGMRLLEAFIESSQQKLKGMPLNQQTIKERQHG